MNTLTETERAERDQLESVIAVGIASFVEVGNALLTISEKRLYRETHGSFEPYCREKWSMSARRAYQLCEAAKVVGSVNNCSQITTESQARELARVPAEKRAEVLAKAGDKPTARKIREAAIVDVEEETPHIQSYTPEPKRTYPAALEKDAALRGVDLTKLDAVELTETAAKCIEMAEISIENLRYLIDEIKAGKVDCGELKDIREQNTKLGRWLHALSAEIC